MQVERPEGEYVLGEEPEGLIGRVSERFPLGRGLEPVNLGDEPPSADPESRPFGLSYLTPMTDNQAVILDLSEVTYCSETQISLLKGSPFILAGTKIRTVTDTERIDDRQRFRDKDEDVTSD